MIRLYRRPNFPLTHCTKSSFSGNFLGQKLALCTFKVNIDFGAKIVFPKKMDLWYSVCDIAITIVLPVLPGFSRIMLGIKDM